VARPSAFFAEAGLLADIAAADYRFFAECLPHHAGSTRLDLPHQFRRDFTRRDIRVSDDGNDVVSGFTLADDFFHPSTHIHLNLAEDLFVLGQPCAKRTATTPTRDAAILAHPKQYKR